MEEELIPEREFEEVWGVHLTPTGDLFQFNAVRHQPLNRVWSIVESGSDDDGNWYAIPGFHVVNVLGYVMTKKAWSSDTPHAIYFLDDFDNEDAEEQHRGSDD